MLISADLNTHTLIVTAHNPLSRKGSIHSFLYSVLAVCSKLYESAYYYIYYKHKNRRF